MGDVKLTIHADVTDAIKGVEKVTASTEHLTDETKKYETRSKEAFSSTKKTASEASAEIKKVETSGEKMAATFKMLSGIMAGAFSVGAIIAFTKQVIASTDATSDAMEKFQEGAKQAMGFLMRAIANVDFNNLIKGFGDAYRAGKKFADQMDELEDRRRALSSQTRDIDLEIIRQRTIAKTRSLDVKDRQAAIDEIIRLEELKLKKTKEITQDALQAQLDLAAVQSNLRQEEILDLITNFDKYKETLKEGEALQKELDTLYAAGTTSAKLGARGYEIVNNTLDAYNAKLDSLTPAQEEAIRLAKGFNNVVEMQREAIVSASNADKDATIAMAQSEESLQRIRNGLNSEFMKGEKEVGETKKEVTEVLKNNDQQRVDSLDSSVQEMRRILEKMIQDFINEPIEIKIGIDDNGLMKEYDEVFKLLSTTTGSQTQEIQRQIDLLNEWKTTGVEDAAQFEEAIAKLQEQLKGLNTWAEDNPFWSALGLDNQEQLDALKSYADEILNVITQIVDGQVEASERLVDDLNQRIDEQQQSVNREFELKQEGLANNYQVESENLKQMQKARDEAIKEREKNIQTQRTLSTIESGISLVVAAANIMKGFSEIPVVGVVLGILAVGAMIAAFVAAQSQIGDATQMAEGGLLRGKRHSEGGIRIPGTGIEVEGDEYVTNRRSTQKYLPLLEAINSDDRDGMRIFFDRKFINKMPQNKIVMKDIDDSKRLGEIVRELKKGKAEVIYGDGFIVEKIGGYTKRINLN